MRGIFFKLPLLRESILLNLQERRRTIMKKLFMGLSLLLLAMLIINAEGMAQKGKGKKDKDAMPEWISKPGVYDDVIIGAGIGEGLTEQKAKSQAEQDARTKIARVIETNVQSLTTNFMEEATTTTGQGSSSAAQEYFSEITQTMTALTLKNVIIEEYWPPKGQKVGKDKIKFYAKAVLRKADLEKAFKDQVAQDAAQNKIKGVKLSADKALAALDKAIANWNKSGGAMAEAKDESSSATTGGEKTSTGITTGGGKTVSDIGGGTATGGQQGITCGKDWIKTLPNMPKCNGYYQGLGGVAQSNNNSEDMKKAESEARAMIIRAIRSEITSKVTSVMEETTKGGATDYNETFSSVTESFSQETLKNLKVEFYTDKKAKKVYAYCEISIAEVERQFAERLRKAINVAKTYYMEAKKAENSGDYYLALTQYLEGAKEIVIAELINKEPIEGDIDGSGKNVSVRATFDTQLKNLLGKMRVEIVSGDMQRGVKGEPLGAPLVAKLVYDRGGSVVPVKNALLASYSVDPTVVKADETAKTDGSGIAQFTVHSVETVNPSGQNKVRVGLSVRDFEAFAQQLPGALEKARSVFKDFTFTAKGSAITKIVILIFEENIGKPQEKSIVEDAIVKQLATNKFKVIDKSEVFRAVNREAAKAAAESSNDDIVVKALQSVADVLVIGSVKAMESVGGASNPYGGGSSNRVSAWASCSIRGIDLETGKIIAVSSKEQVKGISVGAAEKAGIVALQNLSKEASAEILKGLSDALK